MHQSISAAPIPPPGNREVFAHLVSPEGGALANLVRPRGSAFAYSGATPGLLTHAWFPTLNPNMEEFIGKDQQFGRLARPSKLRTGQTWRGFLDFMHFFIAYQGTTWAIGNDQRESTYVCFMSFIDQGFYDLNLVAMILKLSWSFNKF